MLIIGAFNLGHGYFVNSFINLTYVTTPSWCQFTKGAITQAANGGGLPLSTFACATTIYNAQVAVDANNCAQGVWKKVNYNSTFFCPYSDEMLGYWNCTTQAVIPLDMTRFSNVSNANQFDTTVNNILRNQSFLYQQAIPPTVCYTVSTTEIRTDIPIYRPTHMVRLLLIWHGVRMPRTTLLVLGALGTTLFSAGLYSWMFLLAEQFHARIVFLC